MRNTLICLIGNRDLQLKADANPGDSVWKAFINDNFQLNNDDPNYKILNKNRYEPSFYELSRKIYDNYQQFADFIHFPMIELALATFEEKPDKLVFSSSHQIQPDPQDTFIFGEIATCYFPEMGYECEHHSFDSSPLDFKALVDYYLPFFQYYAKQNEALYVENAGGTPDMRAASHFAGLFKGITFISISARQKKAYQETFQAQENFLLKNMAESMTEVYDYEGIRRLPVDDEIKAEAKKGIDRYNLNVGLQEIKDYKVKARKGIDLILENMRINFVQGRYADVVGRIWRFEEAVWQLLTFLQLEKDGLIENTDKNGNLMAAKTFRINSKKKKEKVKFETEFLKNKQKFGKTITDHYPSHFYTADGGTTYFSQYPDKPIDIGTSFYYFFFKSLGHYENLTKAFAQLNNGYKKDSELNKLRNHSILGHGLSSVSREAIEDITGPFQEFYQKMRNLVEHELDVKPEAQFDQLNQIIIQRIKSYENH